MKIEDKEEVYQRFIRQENHKKVVLQFYNSINAHNWDKVEELMHKDFPNPPQQFLDPEFLELRRKYMNLMQPYFETNNKKLAELGKDINITFKMPPTNLKEIIDIMKLEAKFENPSHKIFNIFAEDNIVIVISSWEFTEVTTHVTTEAISHSVLLLEDNKIRGIETSNDFLDILVQIGKIAYDENDEIKINAYLNNLKKLGIIKK